MHLADNKSCIPLSPSGCYVYKCIIHAVLKCQQYRKQQILYVAFYQKCIKVRSMSVMLALD